MQTLSTEFGQVLETARMLSVSAAVPPDVWKGYAFSGAGSLFLRATPAKMGAAQTTGCRRVAASPRLAAHRAAEPREKTLNTCQTASEESVVILQTASAKFGLDGEFRDGVSEFHA